MKNLFLINYKDRYLLKEEIDKIIKQYDCSLLDIVKYDFEEDNTVDILNDIITIPLLDTKCILVDDFTLLDEKKEYTKNFIDAFYSDSENIVILTYSGNKPQNHELYNVIKTIGRVYNVTELKEADLEQYVIKRFARDGYQFDPSLTATFVSRCDNDLSIINNEIDKLELYKIKDKDITYLDIQALVPDNSESSIYDLLDAFVANDKKKLLEIYQGFIDVKVDELYILNMIANKLEEILYVKILTNKRTSKDEIADFFKVKPGKAYYMMKNASSFSENKLKEMIKKLNQLDFNIKSGYIDKKTGLELFILGA